VAGSYGTHMTTRQSVKRVERLAKAQDLEGLIEALDTDRWQVQLAAASALTRLAEPQTVDFLLGRLKSLGVQPRVAQADDETHEEYVWGVIASALGNAAEPGSPTADYLLAVLEWPDGPPSRIASEALAEMGDRRAIEPLLRRLETMDYTSEDAVRGDLAYTSEALGTLRAVEAVDPLIAALEVAGEGREWVAEALEEIGDPRAVPALAAQLEPEPPFFVGNAIVNALEELGTPEAKAAVAAWFERGETPPDTHEWRIEAIPPAMTNPLGRWWFKPWWWPGWLSWQWKLRR
jgi:HEAT repeat protein